MADVIQPLTNAMPEQVLDRLWSIVSYIASAAEHVQEDELYRTMTSVFEEAEGVMSTIAEKWIAEGREEGREEGALQMILALIRSRFGLVPEALQDILTDCTFEQLDDVLNIALEAGSLDDLVEKVVAFETDSETSPSS